MSTAKEKFEATVAAPLPDELTSSQADQSYASFTSGIQRGEELFRQDAARELAARAAETSRPEKDLEAGS